LEEELENDAVLLPVLFNLYSEYFIKETVESCGNFKIGEKVVIHTLKNAYDLELLAMEEAVLRGMIERLIEI
jgi:hypothetical protein